MTTYLFIYKYALNGTICELYIGIMDLGIHKRLHGKCGQLSLWIESISLRWNWAREIQWRKLALFNFLMTWWIYHANYSFNRFFFASFLSMTSVAFAFFRILFQLIFAFWADRCSFQSILFNQKKLNYFKFILRVLANNEPQIKDKYEF